MVVMQWYVLTYCYVDVLEKAIQEMFDMRTTRMLLLMSVGAMTNSIQMQNKTLL